MKRNDPGKLWSAKYGCFQLMDHFFGPRRVDTFFKKNRNKLQEQILDQLKKRGEGHILPVERRRNLSLEAFKTQYVKKGIPVILEGAAKDWPCCRKWSLDYFRKMHGADEVVMVNQHRIHEKPEQITLAEIIDDIKAGGDRYYRFYPLLARHPEHIADFDYKWLRARRHRLTVAEAFQVFIGGKNKYTPIHNASACNLFVQVYGEKKWILYDHHCTPVIDPEPVRNIYRNAPYKTGVPFDPFRPDYNAYPAYKYLHAMEAHLYPGDILWNPPYVWHTVRNETDAIGVGYRWIAPAYSWRLAPLYYTLELFAANPNIFRAYRLFKKDFNLVQLAESGKLEAYIREMKEKEQSV